MVALEVIQDSVGRIAGSLPEGLVGVFIGATSGIGETSMRQFVKYTVRPRIYFVGRSVQAADRLKAELLSLNKDGTYTFIQADISLLKNVDNVCAKIKSKEKAVNVIFLSSGTLVTGTRTAEDLHFFTALTYYSRMRFIINLLPLLESATALRRVVTVMAGGKEGPMFLDNFASWKLPMAAGRGHLASMMTLTLEMMAKRAPTVSFVHDYPGFVKSNLARDFKGPVAAVGKGLFALVGLFLNTPLDQVGQYQTFLATSARFPPGSSESGSKAEGVPLPKTLSTAVGSDGKVGSGVYSASNDGEVSGSKVQKLLEGFRQDGSQDKLWKHLDLEFVRVTGSIAAQ